VRLLDVTTVDKSIREKAVFVVAVAKTKKSIYDHV
jgi:hypothetical protein